MAQEDFLKQLWRALRQSAPAVTADSDSVDAIAVERRLFATDLWLTPKIVDGYDPADFFPWPVESREALTTAVEAFRLAASAVPPTVPATLEQRTVAAERFRRIIDTVGPIVRSGWVDAVEALVSEAESWCRARDWPAKRSAKSITEPLLGKYEAAQLLVHLPEGRFVLTPVSRFVAGGIGLIDLYAMPALGGRSIVRRDTGWELIPTSSRDRPKPWTEATFVNAIQLLAREAA